MSKNIYKLTIISLVLTCLLIMLISHSDMSYSNDSNDFLLRRNLIVKEDYIKNCINKNTTDLIEINSGIKTIKSTFSNILSSLTYVKTDQQSNLKLAIVNEDSSAIRSIVVDLLAPYLIFVIFGIITIFMWIVYWICCCKQCCCCKSRVEEKKCCSFTMIIISVVCIAGIIAVCIVGFVVSNDIPSELDAADCSLYKFYYSMFDGDSRNVTPKWVGLDQIDNTLNKLASSLDTIKSNTGSAFKDTSFTTQSYNEYNNLLLTSYNNNFNQQYASSPNPFSNSPIQPGFIEFYGPYTKSGTTTYYLSQEFKTYIVGITNTLSDLQVSTKYINDNISDAKVIFTTIISNMQPIRDHIDKLDAKYLTKFTDFKINSAKPLVNAFIGLNAAILGISLLFILFTIFFVLLDIKWMRFVSHITWNLITLITIPLFVLAGVFGLLGTAFIYMGPLIEVVFSRESLIKIFTGNQDMVDIIDTCMNKNGNLETILVPNTKINLNLKNFVVQSNKIKEVEYNNTQFNGSFVAYNNKNTYASLRDNPILDNSTNANSLFNSINNLTLYTDYSNKTYSFQKNCSYYIYDQWTVNNKNCKQNYEVISNTSSPAYNIGDETCINLKDWKNVNIKSRYNVRPDCFNIDYSDIVSSYATSINNYIKDSEIILTSLTNEMTSFGTSYSNTILKLKNAFDAVKTVINPMLDIIQNQIGLYGKLYDILNCGFLANEAALVVETFQPVGSTIIQIAACFGALALINWLLLIFGLIFLNRKLSYDKLNNKQLVSDK